VANISGGLGAPEAALITQLPGFHGTFPSKHYGGYITVDENNGRNLYYYFVESERSPTEDPVVLWLNGGPGWSSFDGFVYEHGPFNFRAGNESKSLPQLDLNPYSWSKVSSMIYLDSPAGTGLSVSTNTSDYITGDLKTASDSHIFLLKWFQNYPEFLGNPFFISGESYAGVYVPTLSNEIVKGIQIGLQPSINFKGYLLGNPATDMNFDGNSLVPFAHGMGLISDELFQEANHECQGNFWNSENKNCQSKLDQIHNAIDDLNVYNILEPCYHNLEDQSANVKLPSSFRMLGDSNIRQFPVRNRMFGHAWPFNSFLKLGEEFSGTGSHAVPCSNDELANLWLNTESVRDSIHALPVKDVDWLLSSNRIKYTPDAGSMINYHVKLTKKGYRALIYSGDHDLCIPFTGTEAWTRSLGYKIIDQWRPWYLDNQVSGYTQGYEYNLTFLTIKVFICFHLHREISLTGHGNY